MEKEENQNNIKTDQSHEVENVEQNINRYITARGFEWTNKRSFIIGFSLTLIISKSFSVVTMTSSKKSETYSFFVNSFISMLVIFLPIKSLTIFDI